MAALHDPLGADSASDADPDVWDAEFTGLGPVGETGWGSNMKLT